MTEIEDINRNITYMQGPQGQRVVVVPTKRESTKEEDDTAICCCCVIITIILATICIFLGTVYGSIMLSLRRTGTEHGSFYEPMTTAAIWLLAIGAFFVVISVCIFKYVGHMNKARRHRFMYRDNSGGHRIRTIDTYEDNEGRFAIRAEIPSRTNNTFQDQRLYVSQAYGTSPRDYGRRQSPSPIGMRYGIPPVRNNYILYDSEQRRVPTSEYQPQFHQPERPYTDTMYYEAASQFRSPVTERSFSPASDTTYLSHYSTRSDSHRDPIN
ncbi:uncharacterized protein [Palaemon carinicauda]|uniref:uncharacterized protein isoform X1 n=1 Tax=Palaemon carinicauda TaxID=392227 RepID=UPI0035B6AA5F